MNKALKPCPFCGSTNLVDHKNYIVCNFCGACGPELGAPVDWNIRQEDSLLKNSQSFGKIKCILTRMVGNGLNTVAVCAGELKL